MEANNVKPFSGTSTSLSPSEQKLFRAVEPEQCAVCGKEIRFNSRMDKANYHYKISRNGKTKHYCGYSHMQVGRMRGD